MVTGTIASEAIDRSGEGGPLGFCRVQNCSRACTPDAMDTFCGIAHCEVGPVMPVGCINACRDPASETETPSNTLYFIVSPEATGYRGLLCVACPGGGSETGRHSWLVPIAA